MRLRKYMLRVSDFEKAMQTADRLRQMGFTEYEDAHASDDMANDSLYDTETEGSHDREKLVFIRRSWGSLVTHFILFVAVGIGAIYPLMLRYWPLMAYAAIPVPNFIYALYSRCLPPIIVIEVRNTEHSRNNPAG